MRSITGFGVPLLYQGEALRYVTQCDIEVANVGNGECRRISPPVRVVAVDEHPARLPYCRRPKAGAAAVGCADIEWDAGNTERGAAVTTSDR
jgi:hypothetical protein